MGADGGFEVGFHGEYREIVPNERIVSTEAYEGVPDADANATLSTLDPHRSGRTHDPHVLERSGGDVGRSSGRVRRALALWSVRLSRRFLRSWETPDELVELWL
jgi:uncharacterized protein YndB with AHSA1/START domain